MVRITRKLQNVDMLRAYKIYIDGVYRGKIKFDETKEFKVEKGIHKVRAKIDWGGSNTLSVDVSDSVVELEVGNAVTGWKSLFLKYYITFGAHKYLFLREKGIEPEETATPFEAAEEVAEKKRREREETRDRAIARAQELRDKFDLK